MRCSYFHPSFLPSWYSAKGYPINPMISPTAVCSQLFISRQMLHCLFSTVIVLVHAPQNSLRQFCMHLVSRCSVSHIKFLSPEDYLFSYFFVPQVVSLWNEQWLWLKKKRDQRTKFNLNFLTPYLHCSTFDSEVCSFYWLVLCIIKYQLPLGE